jgi:hypothetical protein
MSARKKTAETSAEELGQKLLQSVLEMKARKSASVVKRGRAEPASTRLAMRAPQSPRLLEGGCLCGAIRFRAQGVPGKPHTCSCETCRRHSGALTVVWVEYPADAVAWVGPGGRPSAWRSSPWSSRAFCPACGTTLGALDDAPTVALVTGAFDKPHLRELAPTDHSYRSRRPRWWHVRSDHEG